MKTIYKIKNRDEVIEIALSETRVKDFFKEQEAKGFITKHYKIEKEDVYFPKNGIVEIKNISELKSLIDKSYYYNKLNIKLDKEICDFEFNRILYKINKNCKLYINNNRYDYYNFRTKLFSPKDFDIVLNAREVFKQNGEPKYYVLNDIFNKYVVKEYKAIEELYLQLVYLDENNNYQLKKINKNYEFSDKLVHKTKEYNKYKKSKEILVYLTNFYEEDKTKLFSYLREKVGLKLVIVDQKDKKFHRFNSYSRMYDTSWGEVTLEKESNREYGYAKYSNELRSNFIHLKEEGLLYKFFNIEYKTFDIDLVNLYKLYRENQELVNQDMSSHDYERVKELMNNENLTSFDTTLIALYSKAKDEEEFKSVGFSDKFKDKQKLKAEKLAEEDLY